MTQNQIAYWANVEKERSNRRNEEISAAAQRSKELLEQEQRNAAAASAAKSRQDITKSEQDILKSKYDIMTNVMGATGGTSLERHAAGQVAAEVLGITPIASTGVTRLKDEAKGAVANAFSSVANAFKKGAKSVGNAISTIKGGDPGASLVGSAVAKGVGAIIKKIKKK